MANALAVNPALNGAVDQFILDAERAHDVINGDATKEVIVEDGSLIPSIRKALLDNLYFKTPPLAWTPGQLVRVFNQLYTFPEANGGSSWWYAPAATNTNPVQMGANPHNDPKWRLIIDTASIGEIYATKASPLFTGNPRAPTPAVGDNSTSLATTAFVSAAIAAALASDPEGGSNFFDISVTNQATLNKLDVSGQANFSAGIDAKTSQMLLNTLRIMDDDGKIDFDYIDPAYAGKLRTVLRPHSITTSLLTVDDIKTATVEIGTDVPAPSGTANVLIVHGNADMDYVHITGNGSRPGSDAQLVVDGKAVIKDLNVTGNLTGAGLGVDGKDIAPNKVTTDTIDARIVNVSEKLTVAGDTEVHNLNVTGTVTGIGLVANVDGLDIKPKSVVATEDVGVGGSMTVNGPTNVGDLNITGTVTGLVIPTPSVDGVDINPDSVVVDGVFSAVSEQTDNDTGEVTRPASLTASIPLESTQIDNSGKITTQTLQVNGQILGPDGLPKQFGVDAYTKTESDGKYVPNTRTVAGKPLTANVVITAADVGAVPVVAGQVVDANLLTTNGIFSCSGSTTNTPVAQGGVLENFVRAGADNRTQMFSVVAAAASANAGKRWVRAYDSATWTPWTELVTNVSAGFLPVITAGQTTIDTLVSAGVYAVNADATGSPISGTLGSLIVIPWSTARCVQEYFTQVASGVQTTRTFIRYGGTTGGVTTWGPWVEFYSPQNKPTPAAIGALATANNLSEFAGYTLANKKILSDNLGSMMTTPLPVTSLTTTPSRLDDPLITEKNQTLTINATMEDGPLGSALYAALMINYRRAYNAGCSLVQVFYNSGGVGYIRTAGGGPGAWTWNGLASGADANGWRKMYDSAVPPSSPVGSVTAPAASLSQTVDLNTLGFADGAAGTGIYYQSRNSYATPALNYPEGAAGTLLVSGGGNSAMQTYITFNTGNIWIRGASGAWNGTNGPWNTWVRSGSSFLADYGIGRTTFPALASSPVIDFQQFDFTTGSNYMSSSSAFLNTPAGVVYAANTGVSVSVDYIASTATRIGLTLIPDTALDSNYKIYHLLGVGAKGSRVWTVRSQIISSAGSNADITALPNVTAVGSAATPVAIPKISTQLITLSTKNATISTSTYQPDNGFNVHNLTVATNTSITAMATPAGAVSYMMYFQQDATGGRVVTFDSSYVPLGDATVNTAANSVTVVQVLYRGTGSLYDLIITPRP